MAFRASVVGVGSLLVFLRLDLSGASKNRSRMALISQLKISFARKGSLNGHSKFLLLVSATVSGVFRGHDSD